MTMSNLRRMILVAACAVAIFGLLVSRAVAGGPIQIHLDHWQNGGTPDTSKKWIDGNLHTTNSTYTEGDFLPTRFVLDNLTAGQQYTLTFRWLAAKHQGGEIKHAHDYFATYNQSGALVTGVDPCLPRFQGGGNGPNVCNLATTPDSIANVPADTVGLVGSAGWSGTQTAGQFSMWGGTINNVGTSPGFSPPDYTYDPNALFNNSNQDYHNKISIKFTVSAGGAANGVVLALGAHMALRNDWDSLVTDGDSDSTNDDNGSCNINGAPYHWDYELFSNTTPLQSGSRDRSIMCTGSNPTGSITVQKNCQVGTDPFVDLNTVFSFTGTDPLPASFQLSCGGAPVQALIPANSTGTFTVTETQFAFGWGLFNISCTGASNGVKYLGKQGGTDNFELGDFYIEIGYKDGDNVSCTFTNGQARMPLHKLIDGLSATCTDDPNTQAVETGDDGIRPCSYATTPPLTLTANDPRFTINLYLTGQNGQPLALPGPPSPAPGAFPLGYLAQAIIPPKFEAPGLIGIPLSLCEAPSSPYSLLSVSVVVTDLNNNQTTINPAVYYLQGYGCFNILIPNGTTRFEISLNNSIICSYTQGGWGQDTANGNNVASIRNAGFLAVYGAGNGVQVGRTPGARPINSVTTGPHAIPRAILLNGPSNVAAYLPAGTTPKILDKDYLNPLTTGSGVFGGQVLALELNVDYGNAGLLLPGGGGGGIGSFLINTGPNTCENGQTVSQVLADANAALSGVTPLPANCGSISALNNLVDMLNNSFDACRVQNPASILTPPAPRN